MKGIACNPERWSLYRSSHRRLVRTDPIIVGDIALLPVSPDAAEGFYRLVVTKATAFASPKPSGLELCARCHGGAG